MLWPPPTRGERVMLTCACQADVVWRIPLLFVYWVRLAERHPECARVGHVFDKRVFVALETIESRAESEPSA
jgi:hypothetical protein